MYAIKVSIITEDGDEELFEIVPSVSYEQGCEALSRILNRHKKKVAQQETIIEE